VLVAALKKAHPYQAQPLHNFTAIELDYFKRGLPKGLLIHSVRSLYAKKFNRSIVAKFDKDQFAFER